MVTIIVSFRCSLPPPFLVVSRLKSGFWHINPKILRAKHGRHYLDKNQNFECQIRTISGGARISPPLSDILALQGRPKEIMLNVFWDRASFYHVSGLIEHSLPSILEILVFLIYRLDAASYQKQYMILSISLQFSNSATFQCYRNMNVKELCLNSLSDPVTFIQHLHKARYTLPSYIPYFRPGSISYIDCVDINIMVYICILTF
jgi:hypothetical protein